MNKIMITAIAALIATSALAETTVALPTKSPADTSATTELPIGCTESKTVNSFLNNNGFVVLYRSQRVQGTYVESWINSKSQVVTVSYLKPADNNADSIKEVCVVDFSSKVVYNGDTVEILNKALDKATPKI